MLQLKAVIPVIILTIVFLAASDSFATTVNTTSDFDNAVSDANLKNPTEPVYQDKILNDFIVEENCQILARDTYGNVTIGHNGEKISMPENKRAAVIYAKCGKDNMVFKSGYRQSVVFKDGKKGNLSNSGVPPYNFLKSSFKGKPAQYDVQHDNNDTINIMSFYGGNDKYYTILLYASDNKDQKEVLNQYASDLISHIEK